MPRPTVKTKCVADAYHAPNQRIIEFNDPKTGAGGLISFLSEADGSLTVGLYRLDECVTVIIPEANKAQQ